MNDADSGAGSPRDESETGNPQWPGEYSDEELIDDAAYEVMGAVNESGESWADDEYLRSAAEWQVKGLPLDDEHVDEIVERAIEEYGPEVKEFEV